MIETNAGPRRGSWVLSAILGVALATLGTLSVGAQDSSRRRPTLIQEDPASFESAWKSADGPSALRALDLWCQKNRLAKERSQVLELLGRLTPPAHLPSDHALRERARSARDESRKAVQEFLASRMAASTDAIGKIIEWMRAEKYAPESAKVRLAELAKKILPPGATDLERSIPPDLEHSPRSHEDDAKLAREFTSRTDGLQKGLTDRLLFAVEKTLAAGEPGFAFDLFQELLRIDPDNLRARKALGQVRVGDRWLRPFEVEQQKVGLEWHERLGWVLSREKSRYEKGEYFDLDAKKWAKQSDLDKAHSDPAFPWRLQGEHFDLLSTADLEVSVKVLSRLEAFFLGAFRHYDLFFVRGTGGPAASLIFGVTPAKRRLSVHFYRSQAQFRERAKPPTAWAAGFYDPAKRASHFYADGPDFNASTLQHEITHQILAEFSEGGNAPAWLVEGAAVYLEEALVQDGALVLPSLDRHSRLAGYKTSLRAGSDEHSLRKVLGFQTAQDWDSGDIAKNYRGAGAAFFFLATFDGGRYRGDTITLLRDAYAGKARPIEEYFGLSQASLEILMRRFYAECELPSAKGDDRGPRR